MEADHPPLLLLAYEQEAEGQTVCVARSIMTGDVAMGTTRKRALDCLLGTIQMAMKLALEGDGTSADDWIQSRRPADAKYAAQWVLAAKERGIEYVPFPAERVAMVNAA